MHPRDCYHSAVDAAGVRFGGVHAIDTMLPVYLCRHPDRAVEQVFFPGCDHPPCTGTCRRMVPWAEGMRVDQ